MNYFAQADAASRYVSSRPYIHPTAIAYIKAFLNLQQPVAHALDVACGTGASSLALTTIASEVIGVDPAQEMLRHAVQDERIRYTQSSAENLPFPASSFDLITVALAFHWLDRVPFLTEANRVLQISGYLVIYSGGLIDTPQSNPAFRHWYGEQFLLRFPFPSRYNKQPLNENEAASYGFRFLGKERYALSLPLSALSFVNYLMSLSHINAVIAQKGIDAEEIAHQLLNEVAPLFIAETETFLFGGIIEYWQKEL